MGSTNTAAQRGSTSRRPGLWSNGHPVAPSRRRTSEKVPSNSELRGGAGGVRQPKIKRDALDICFGRPAVGGGGWAERGAGDREDVAHGTEYAPGPRDQPCDRCSYTGSTKKTKTPPSPPPLSLLWVFSLSARVTLACSLDLRNPPLTVPALASAVPQNPLSVNAKASGTADAGCIIPGPFHHCICHASASYSATLSTADGVNQTTITNFTAVDAVRDAPDRETGLWGWI